jgi:hypothetical protein
MPQNLNRSGRARASRGLRSKKPFTTEARRARRNSLVKKGTGIFGIECAALAALPCFQFFGTSAEKSIGSRRAAFCRTYALAPACAKLCGHPLSRTEYPLQQRRQVKVRIQLWKVYSQTRRSDFDCVQLGRPCVLQALRSARRKTDIHTRTQVNYYPTALLIVAGT